MALSKEQVDGLLRLVGLTKINEINCDDCLAAVAEFAELQLVGKSLPEGLHAVEHHLSVCDECREEYEALLRTLEKVDDQPD